MLKRCLNCNEKIQFREFYRQTLKNAFKYTCTLCKTTHHATTFSKLLFIIIYGIPPFVTLIFIALGYLVYDSLRK